MNSHRSLIPISQYPHLRHRLFLPSCSQVCPALPGSPRNQVPASLLQIHTETQTPGITWPHGGRECGVWETSQPAITASLRTRPGLSSASVPCCAVQITSFSALVSSSITWAQWCFSHRACSCGDERKECLWENIPLCSWHSVDPHSANIC